MYENAKYCRDPDTGEIGFIGVDINGNAAMVPITQSNRDYRNIMKLVEEGKLVIAPAD